MRVIFFENARVTLLFPFEEVVPISGADGKAIVAAVGGKYSFQRLPDLSIPREEINKNGLKFEGGQIIVDGKLENIQMLAAYNDGLIIDANTTDRAEAFLDDLVAFLRSEFGFREFSSKPRKFFASQIVAELEKPVSRLINGFEKISSAIGRATASIYGEGIPRFDFCRLDFQIDPSNKLSPNPSPRFIIERRAGAPFDQERYFCAAPMPTQQHIKLLEELEQLA